MQLMAGLGSDRNKNTVEMHQETLQCMNRHVMRTTKSDAMLRLDEVMPATHGKRAREVEREREREPRLQKVNIRMVQQES